MIKTLKEEQKDDDHRLISVMTKRKQCDEEEIAALEINIQNVDIVVTEATDQR